MYQTTKYDADATNSNLCLTVAKLFCYCHGSLQEANGETAPDYQTCRKKRTQRVTDHQAARKDGRKTAR